MHLVAKNQGREYIQVEVIYYDERVLSNDVVSWQKSEFGARVKLLSFKSTDFSFFVVVVITFFFFFNISLLPLGSVY